ncbi:CDP-alcohol phosphatidyltransferase family protein [Marinicella litoralis]|uniref:CDP-alcohol phosphatidyltransferase family protein n=1 Tax=Marinicella litoralis TaxID=644220 RepID=UPI0013C3202B|nr:CDP-alcohol phosphatidyltransferase family protein [Marinicella litoralis]
MNLKYLPNIITIARIIAIVPLAWLMWHKEYKGALLIAFLAGLSDGLDGFLAKRYGWQGWLGGILDPLADKFLMFSCYTIFALQGVIPLWLYLLVVFRDVVIVAGASFYHFKIGKIQKATPTLVSKLNTVMQILLILVLLLSYSGLINLFVIHPTMIVVVGLLTLVSGVHYVWMGLSMAKQLRSEKGDYGK